MVMLFIKCWQNATSYKSNYLHWTLVYVYLTFFFLQLWYLLVILHFIKDNSLLSSFLQKQQQKQSCVLSQNAASYKSNYLHWMLVYVYLTFFFLQLWYLLVILHFIKDNSLLSSVLYRLLYYCHCLFNRMSHFSRFSFLLWLLYVLVRWIYSCLIDSSKSH